MNRSPQSSAGVIPPCDAAAPGSRFSPVTAPGITLPAAAAPVVAAGRAPQAGTGTAGEGGPGIAKMAAAMSEDALEAGMRSILKDLGLRLAYHPWKLHAKRAKTGFPDWTIVGIGGLMFRELKRQREKPTRAQQEWLDALTAAGANADVWRPSDLLSGRVARELAALAGIGGQA